MNKDELIRWSRKFYELWNQGLHSDGDIEKANQAHREIVSLLNQAQKPDEAKVEEFKAEWEKTFKDMDNIYTPSTVLIHFAEKFIKEYEELIYGKMAE